MNDAGTGAEARPLVLLTRPVDRSDALAGDLHALGMATISWPVLDIQPVLSTPPALNGAQAVVLTSPRAVEMLPQPLGNLVTAPALCVGSTTADAARRAGFSDIRDAEGDAADLAALINHSLYAPDGHLLYLRGRDVARDIAGLLPHFEVRAVEVYQAEPNPMPRRDIKKVISAGNLAAVALFSPRAAAIFAEAATEEMRDGLAATTAVAMSDRVSAKVNQIAFRNVIVAKRPTGVEMRAAICGACGIAPPQNGVCD